MQKTVIGTIESAVVSKTGIRKDGKGEYTIYKVFINGEEFTTFDHDFAKHIGEQGTFNYDETQNNYQGRIYTNKKLLGYAATQTTTPSPAPSTDPPASNDNVIRGLGILRGDIKSLRTDFETKLTNIENLIRDIIPNPISPPSNPNSTSIQDNRFPVNLPDSEIPVIQDDSPGQ